MDDFSDYGYAGYAADREAQDDLYRNPPPPDFDTPSASDLIYEEE